MNQEYNHILQYCITNKCSLNYKKTNDTILKPCVKKIQRHVNRGGKSIGSWECSSKKIF